MLSKLLTKPAVCSARSSTTYRNMAAAATATSPTTLTKRSLTLRVLGMQGGNAVDGIDACVTDITIQEPTDNDATKFRHCLPGDISFKCHAFQTFPWPESTRELVLRLRDGTAKGREYGEAMYQIGHCFADAAESLLELNSDIDRSSIELVSSHGQSVLGHPHWEMGDLSVLASRLGVTAVGDFRSTDVAVGGNGSPCTCTFDALLLSPAVGWRLCVNIGGTTTITVVPSYRQFPHCIPVGLDPGIGVFYMDLNAQAESDGECQFDESGKLARSGTMNEELLAYFFKHPHTQRTTLPISIGAEDYTRQQFQEWREYALNTVGVSGADLQCTLTEYTARSIAVAAARFGGFHGTESEVSLSDSTISMDDKKEDGPRLLNDVVVRGQVRRNVYFMERLSANLRECLHLTEDPVLKGVSDLDPPMPEDSWETCMYAIFGALNVHGMYNFVPTITGASKPVVGGKIAPGENFGTLMRKLCK